MSRSINGLLRVLHKVCKCFVFFSQARREDKALQQSSIVGALLAARNALGTRTKRSKPSVSIESETLALIPNNTLEKQESSGTKPVRMNNAVRGR